MILRLLKKMSVVERVALSVSIVYAIGMLTLVQHNAIYMGLENLDYIRLKPIIVGVEFLIYVAIPVATVCLPVLWAARKKCGIALKTCFAFAGISFFALAFPMMLHYFMPFLAKAWTVARYVPPIRFAGKPYALAMWDAERQLLYAAKGVCDLTRGFWSMYFCFGLHWIGFLALFYAIALWRARRFCISRSSELRRWLAICAESAECGGGEGASAAVAALAMRAVAGRRFSAVRLAGRIPFLKSRAAIPICILAGGVFLLYYFNRDCYMNISQSAGGGAPQGGILVLRPAAAPNASGVKDNAAHANEEIPCWLLGMDSERIAFYEHDSRQYFGPARDKVLKIVPKERFAEFMPLSVGMRASPNGKLEVIDYGMSFDPVHRLDVVVRVEYSIDVVSTNAVESGAASRPEGNEGGKPIEMSLTMAGCPLMKAEAGSQMFVPLASLTNCVEYIEFNLGQAMRGKSVADVMLACDKDAGTKFGLDISNIRYEAPLAVDGVTVYLIANGFYIGALSDAAAMYEADLPNGRIKVWRE